MPDEDRRLLQADFVQHLLDRPDVVDQGKAPDFFPRKRRIFLVPRESRGVNAMARFFEIVAERTGGFRMAPHAVEQDDVGHEEKFSAAADYLPANGVVRKRRV